MFDQLDPTTVVAIIIVGVLTVAAILWQRWNRNRFEAQLRHILPDEIEPYVMSPYYIATKAVDQIAKAYGNMSNEDKLAMGLKFAVALLKFFKTGNLTPDANRALIEYQKYIEHNPTPPKEVAVRVGG